MFGIDDLIAGGGAVLGGLLGGGKSDEGYKKAAKSQQDFIDYIKGLNPEAASAVSQDPAVRNAQMTALRQLQDVASQGGMDTESQVAERQAMDAANANARANRGAITSAAAQRGTLGGGQELAAKLMAQQGSSNQAANAGAQAASDARTRALQAMQAGGNQAANIAGTDLGYQAAKDSISKFNAAQRLNQGQIAGQGYTNLANLAVGQGQNAQKNTAAAGAGLGGLAGDVYGMLKGGDGGGSDAGEGIVAPQMYADGGEVPEDDGAWSAIKAWIRGKPGDEKASRKVADSINAALPEGVSARRPVKNHNRALDDAYAATMEHSEGGEVKDPVLGKKKDAELPEADLDVYRGETAKKEKKKGKAPTDDGKTMVASSDDDEPERYYRGGVVDGRRGGHVPGTAPHPGNDRRNDVVPALLSPGEDVIDRETMARPDAPAAAAAQVAKIKALRRLQGRE